MKQRYLLIPNNYPQKLTEQAVEWLISHYKEIGFTNPEKTLGYMTKTGLLENYKIVLVCI